MPVLRLAIRGLQHRLRQTVLSTLGVLLGVLALTVILSVSNGFETDLIEDILDTTGHIQVFSAREREVSDPTRVCGLLQSVPGVEAAAPGILVQGMIENPEAFAFAGTNIKGIVPEQERLVNSVGREMVAGVFAFESDNQIIVGAELARQLEAKVGKPLKLTIPDGEQRELIVSGIFKTGVTDFDFQMVFIPLALAQKTFGFENSSSHIFVRTNDPMKAREIASRIKEATGYDTLAWLDTNRTLLDAISLERRVMFVVIFLTLVVAAFGISNVLTMMVMEKYRDIGILRAMGMKGGQVVNVFLLQGMFIGIMGTILGCLGGYAVGILLETFPVRLPLDVYNVDHVPVAFRFSDFASIALLACAISLIASYLPARKALRIDPAEAIRYYA